MSSTFYCVGCDAMMASLNAQGKCMTCRAYVELIFTYDQLCILRNNYEWIIRHMNGRNAGQSLDFVKVDDEAYECFIDGRGSDFSLRRSKTLSDMASALYEESVPSEKASQNTMNVIRWRLSKFLEKQTVPDDSLLQRRLRLRACLYEARYDDRFSAIQSCLEDLLLA